MGFAALLKPLLSDGALPGWYKELVATRMSVLQDSLYAATAHSFSARQKGATEEHVAAVKSDFERGPFTEAEKLGLRCADRLHHSPREIDDDFYAKLKGVYSDPQIVELIATASVFEFFPRFVDALRIPVTPAPKNTAAGKAECGLWLSRMSVMSGEGALTIFPRAKELERAGPLHHPSRIRRARLSSCQAGGRRFETGRRRGQRPLLSRGRLARACGRHCRLTCAIRAASTSRPKILSSPPAARLRSSWP